MTSINLTKQQKQSIMAEYSAKMGTKKQGSKTPARSRSRSRTRAVLHTVSTKRAKSQRQTHREVATHVRKNIAPVVQKLLVMKKKMNGIKEGYFDKDSKSESPASVQAQIDLLQKELDMLKNTLRAGLKDKPIRMRLSATFVITTTVTTGVTNIVTIGGSNSALTPSYCTEWATVALLFDEYKMLGGEVDFVYGNINAAPESGAPNWTPDCVPIIAYDADDVTAATSSILLTQSAQHKTFNPGQKVLGAASAIIGGQGGETHHKFKFHIPRGDVDPVSAGGLSIAPGTQWNPSITPLTHGFIKWYHLGSVITAKDTGAGFVYFDFEFRCRV